MHVARNKQRKTGITFCCKLMTDIIGAPKGIYLLVRTEFIECCEFSPASALTYEILKSKTLPSDLQITDSNLNRFYS